MSGRIHDRRHPWPHLVLAGFLALWVSGAASAQQPADADRERAEQERFESWLTGPASVLMTAEELELARELETAEDRRAFRRWFWDRRDPDPDTTRNELRERFHERLAYVDTEFGDVRSRSDRWRTAPGLVYLILGPPSAVAGTGDRVSGRAGSQQLVVWTYDSDDLAFEDERLRVFFVRRRAGLSLAGAPQNIGHPLYQRLRGAEVALNSALSTAVRRSIHSPKLPFGAPGARAAPSPELPVQAVSVRLDPQGLAGELQLSLRELYGQPTDDGIRIRLDLDLPAPGAATDRMSAANGESAGGAERIGSIVLELEGEKLARRADTPLRVALWLPADVWERAGRAGAADAPAPALTEHPTGRTAVIRPADDGEPLPRLYAVDEIVGVAMLAEGEGLAVAFFGTPGRPGDPANSGSDLWLCREPGDAADGVPWISPVEGLHVLRRGNVADSDPRDDGTERE